MFPTHDVHWANDNDTGIGRSQVDDPDKVE
jgi:hypothetical protein